jgi:hypothetical protein
VRRGGHYTHAGMGPAVLDSPVKCIWVSDIAGDRGCVCVCVCVCVSGGDSDPHAFLPCMAYAAGAQPFRVTLAALALAVADVHAHLAHTEVIGYFGGRWDPANRGRSPQTRTRTCTHMHTNTPWTHTHIDRQAVAQRQDAHTHTHRHTHIDSQ